MRAFKPSQCDVFINAFGETVQTEAGTTFRAILEMVPVTVSSGSGAFIESYETYCTAKSDISTVTIGSVLIIRGVKYTVYNIVDDLSGLLDIYYRTVEGQHFAEDY
jgi:hypothetical protein